VTFRAILGLAALNGAYAALGLSLLWAIRGLPRSGDVLRLAGIGYLLGVAVFGVLWTELLVLGVPFGGWGVVLTLGFGMLAACTAALALGRPRPRRSAGSRPPGAAVAVLAGAAGIALTGLLLEALFRSARLQSLQAYDAWAFWVPKAKAIYLFGGLDVEVFTTSAGPTYPPLVPIVDAAAFHAMGSMDVVTLHLQFWFLVTGAVAAVAGCLHRHVPPWFLWPPLLLVLVVPRFGLRLLAPQADVLVDLFFVVAALLLALWLRDGRAWRVAAAAVLLAGATVTKREGLLFAAAALAVALAGSWARRRTAWPVLVPAAVAVGAAALPWRAWYRSHGLGGEAPPDAGLGGSPGRMADALRLSADVFLDVRLWSVAPLVGLIALAATAVWGDRLLAAYAGAVGAAVFLGGAWITFSYADLPISADEAVNPIVRYTGALVLLAGAFVPLLLASAWRGRPERDP
jgi:hypothetical protein